MEIKRTIPLCLMVLLLLWASAGAYDADIAKRFGPPATRTSGVAALAPCISANFSYTIGDLWFPEIYSVGLCLYTGYYPGSSGNLQIFQTGLWAGGYPEDAEGGDPYTAIGTFDQLDFLVYDSVCSGFKVAQAESRSLEVESTFDTGYSPYDLGMTATLRYKMWDDPRLDDFVLIEVGLKFTKDIDHFWWGWMTDCDMGNNDLPDYYYDDLVGFDEVRGVAYMYDDDGDPVDQHDLSSKLLSPTYVGQVLLSGPPPGGRIVENPASGISWETFNWWDWNNDVTGRASAYDRMSQGTIKQYPPDTPFDYRMLTAVGPYDVRAGDSTTFVFGLVMGDGFDSAYWSRRVRAGGEASDMGTLVEHVENLKEFFANGLVMADAAPKAPVLEDPVLDGREVTLSWQSVSEEDDDFAGYRVYRSLVSNIGPWQLIADYPGKPAVNTHKDVLRIGFPTFYLASAYDEGGNESTTGGATCKTLDGVYATTKPSDYDGDCESTCEEECQGCPDCYDRCMASCMNSKLSSAMDNILVAPNPYRGSADWERLDYEGRISFYNLPKRCTIYIHSMTGELVDTVRHNMPGDESPDPAGNETGGESWDMLTANGQSIASGIYIYRVDSPDYGQKIGKFAVIKGE
jgi:hypothetical protein